MPHPIDLFDQPLLLDNIFLATSQLCGGVDFLMYSKCPLRNTLIGAYISCYLTLSYFDSNLFSVCGHLGNYVFRWPGDLSCFRGTSTYGWGLNPVFLQRRLLSSSSPDISQSREPQRNERREKRKRDEEHG